MYWEMRRRIALLGGATAACLCLAVNLLRGGELLHVALTTACVAMLVSLILWAAAGAAGRILFSYYREQQEARQLAEHKAEEEAAAVAAENGTNESK